MYQQNKIDQMYMDRQKRIEAAIDSKQKSIAFHCATDRATILCQNEEDKEKCIEKWVDYYYALWQNWFIENIVPSKDKPYNVSAAKRKVIVEQLKQETGQEEKFNQKEAEHQQKVDSSSYPG